MVKSDLFVNLLDAPYSRRGSFLAFANNNNGEDLFGKCTLWLCNCRNFGGISLDQNNGYRQVKLELIKNAKSIPYVISTTPYEVILESRHGSMRFCIGERRLIMCRSDDALTLRITPTASRVFMAAGAANMMDGTWLINFPPSKLLLIPLQGSMKSAPPCIDIEPDSNGITRLAIEEYTSDPEHRPFDKYPSYDDCVASVKADFDGFCERIAPALPAKYENKRLQAIWQTWNMTVEPDGESEYKRTMIKMIHSLFEAAFAWQQPMQAVWLSNDIKLSWDLLSSGFDHQDPNGRILDALSHRGGTSDALKPPVHGVALTWLMENRDLSSIPLDSKIWLWDRLLLWTDYFFKFRDKDKDGLAEFQALFETGWEDAPYYNVGFPNCSPDLNAYLALQLESLAKLGSLIGKPAAICEELSRRSKKLIDLIVEKLWDGERWFAFNAETGKRSDSSTLSLYTALVLGKRLPQNVIDKSIDFMFGPDGFDTPFGLATEALTSDYFAHGFTKGSIITPAEFLICIALEACGRSDLAAKVANNYCAIMRDHGFFHIHNALTGKEDRSLTAFGERGLFWSAWASSCYLFLAAQYGDAL